MSEDEIEVRELKTKDAFTVARMLLSIGDEAEEEITQLVSEEDLEESADNDEEIKKKTGMRIAINIGQVLIENAEDDLISWLADMTNMEKEEFENTPIETPIMVIEETIEQEGFQDFLSRASSLYSKMNESANSLLND